MTNEEYVLDRGANLSPSFGAYATLIEQAIERATPNSYRGMVVNSDTPPAVVGQPTGYPSNWYAFQARSLWLKSNGELYYYNGTTWEYIRSRPASLTITNGLVADAAIQIGKLSSSGGTAGQLIRATAGGTFEYVDAINTISPNTLPVDRLASPGTAVVSVLRSISGTKSWVTFDSALLVGTIADNAFAVNKLLRGSALQIPMVAADGNSVVWSSVIAAIPDNTIAVTKLAKSVADAGKYLRYATDGTIVAGVPVTETRSTKEILTLPGQGATTSLTHDLTGVPQIVVGYMVCTVADAGYSVGDVIPIHQVTLDFNQTGDIPPDGATAYQFSFDASTIYLTRTASTANALVVYNKTTGANHTFDPTHWKFRFTALLYP